MSKDENSHSIKLNDSNKFLQTQKNYRIILEINNAIISHLNLNSLFLATAKIIREKLPFDYSAICLYISDSDTLRLYNFGKKMVLLPGVELPREGSHVGWVFDNKKVLINSSHSS